MSINELEKQLITIDDKLLNINQSFVYDRILHTDKNYYLQSSTSSGKTFIASHILVKKYEEKCKKNSLEKVLMIVPTELLESQIISNLNNSKSINDEIKIKIGNDPEINDILIMTPEKFFSFKKESSNIRYLIIDESHKLLEESITERDKFLKHLLSEYFSNKELNFLLLSPFYEENYYKKIFDIFKQEQIFLLKLKNNQSNFNKFIRYDQKKYLKDKILINNQVTCYLFKSKKEVFETSKRIYDYKISKDTDCVNLKCEYERLEKTIFEGWQDENIDYHEKINLINSEKYSIYKNYLNIKLINNGICYITSSIPDDIKFLIIDLIKERFIRLILATSIIIDGIDFPIDNTILTTTKINSSQLTVNEFINYIGRSGRINSYKKTSGMSYTAFLTPMLFFNNIKKVNKKNENNKIWIKNNKKTINEILFKNNFIQPDNKYKSDSFVDFSCDKYNETKDKIYILDPRINPDTTSFLFESLEDDFTNYIIETFFDIKINKKDKKIALLKLFLYYRVWEYVGKHDYKFPNLSNEISNYLDISDEYIENKFKDYKIINWICEEVISFISLNFSMDRYIRNKINQLNYKYEIEKIKFNNVIPITKDLENNISLIKFYGKHLTLMFLSHITELKNDDKYPKLNEIISLYIFNKNIFNYVKNTSFSNKFRHLVKNNILKTKHIREWKNKNYKYRFYHPIEYIKKMINLKSKTWNEIIEIIGEDEFIIFYSSIIVKEKYLFLILSAITVK